MKRRASRALTGRRGWLAGLAVVSTVGAGCSLVAKLDEDVVERSPVTDATAPSTDAIATRDAGSGRCVDSQRADGWHVDESFGTVGIGLTLISDPEGPAIPSSFEDGTGLFLTSPPATADGGTVVLSFDGKSTSPMYNFPDRVDYLVASHLMTTVGIAGLGPATLADGGQGAHLDSVLGAVRLQTAELPEMLFTPASVGPHALGSAYRADLSVQLYIVTNVTSASGGSRPALLTVGGQQGAGPSVMNEAIDDIETDGGIPPIAVQTGGAVADTTGVNEPGALSGARSFWVAGISADDGGVAAFFPDAGVADPPVRVRLPFRPDSMTTSVYAGYTGFVVGRSGTDLQLVALTLGTTSPIVLGSISLGDIEIAQPFQLLFANDALTAVSVTTSNDLVLAQWHVTEPDGGALPLAAPGPGTLVTATPNRSFGVDGVLLICGPPVSLGGLGVYGDDYYATVQRLDDGVSALVRIVDGQAADAGDR